MKTKTAKKIIGGAIGVFNLSPSLKKHTVYIEQDTKKRIENAWLMVNNAFKKAEEKLEKDITENAKS